MTASTGCASCAPPPGTGVASHRPAGLLVGYAYQGDARGVAAGIGSHGPDRGARRPEPDGGAVLRGRSTPKSESGEWCDVLGWSQQVIDLADGDPAKGNFIIGSPLAVAFTQRAEAR